MARMAFGLVAVALLAGPGAAQDKPEDTVKKAIEAHGGLAVLKKFPAGTSKISGKVTIGEAAAPFTGNLAFLIPGKVRVEMALEIPGQKATLLQIVNAGVVKQTENGLPSTLDEAVKTELRESAVIQEMSLLYPLLDATKYTLTAEKDGTADGRPCTVILARAKGLKDTRLLFDKKTGYLAGMYRKGLNPAQKVVDEITTFSDYKSIEGTVVPMRSRVTHDGKPFLDITVNEYKPLQKVDEKLFSTD